MNAFLARCERAFNLLVCGVYATLTLIAFAQVIVRYLLGGSLPWSEEAIRFLFVWLSFLGFSVTMSHGGHIGVDFLVSRVPRPLQRGLALISDVLMVGFLVFFMIQGARVVEITMNNRSPAMQIPMGYVYLILPLSAAILLLYTLRQICVHWAAEPDRRA